MSGDTEPEIKTEEDQKMEKTTSSPAKGEESTEEAVSTPNVSEASKKEETTSELVESEPSQELLRAIQEQVEFYLGDINLPRDAFFQEEIKKDDGWIPIETLLKCNRLAKLSTNVKVIASAVASSSLLQVSEEGTKIRRNPDIPLPENSLEYWTGLKKQSVYIKGFRENTTLDEIRKFVKPFGNVINVLMRREKTNEHKFKGSVFVTFKTVEEAEAFINNDVTKYEDMELTKMMQNDYWATKQDRMKERKNADREAKLAKKRKCIDEQKTAHFAPVYAKGNILSLENLPKEDVSVMKLKEFFGKYGQVAFCVYEKGDEKAQLRFSGAENSAIEAWKAAVAEGTDGKVMFNDKEITGKVLEGEEEEAYWVEFGKRIADQKERFSNSNRRRRGGRRGGGSFNDRRGFRKREANEGPEAKKPKVDAAETVNSGEAAGEE